MGKFTVDFDEDEDEDEWGTKDGCRIMAVMYENDLDVAAYAVIIGTEGNKLHFCILLIELLCMQQQVFKFDQEVCNFWISPRF